jgi:hypothetical protein
MKKEVENSAFEEQIRVLARILLPAIESYYNSEEGQAAFAQWKSNQDKDNLKNK